MGWATGVNQKGRDVGYGVEATCDLEGCEEQIDRGLAFVCGGMHDGGDFGCGGYFCGKHLFIPWFEVPSEESHQYCASCEKELEGRLQPDEEGFPTSAEFEGQYYSHETQKIEIHNPTPDPVGSISQPWPPGSRLEMKLNSAGETCEPDGRVLKREDYPELYAIIARTYGGDEDAETFRIPDLRSQMFVANMPDEMWDDVGRAYTNEKDSNGST
jgi:hypothetical protein